MTMTRDNPVQRGAALILDAVRLCLAAIGALLIGYGGWLHYPPLGFAAAGVLLFAVALIGGLRGR